MGRRPLIPLEALVDDHPDGISLTPIEPAKLREHIEQVTKAHEALQERVVEQLARTRQQRREQASRGHLPNFTIGDYVLVARVRQQGRHRKLMSTWTGPWRVANDDRDHVYTVENLVNGETREVHVARTKFYADKDLHVT